MADTLFSTTIPVQTNTTDVDLNYIVSGFKKLEYLTNSFVPTHIEYYHPKFKEFMQVFLRYLDQNSMFKTLNLINNNDLNKMYEEFLDDYVNMYLYDTIDLDKYQLNDENKRFFILLSKLMHNLKGNVKAFAFLFNSFSDIRIADDELVIGVDKITAEFIENEAWWDEGIIKYYDGVHSYDGTEDYSAEFSKPFTYQFKIDQARGIMLPLVRSVHPAGFLYEFLVKNNFDDDLQPQDILQTSTTYYHFYSSGEVGATPYTYDGTINYVSSRTINEIS